jgi:formate hydrogenlyase subunit 3/multisubunit Na+/H+ antiporter MnhD subunit
LFSTCFAAGEWGAKHGRMRYLNTALALNVLAMLVLLSSTDLIGLFIGWELVGWASFLLMYQGGGHAERAAFRYLFYSLSGAMAVLGAIALVVSATASIALADLGQAVGQLSTPALWAVVLMFFAGFGVKMAMMPFHLWQADAYSWCPGPSSAFLGAISSRMGLFAVMVVLVQGVGLPTLGGMSIPYTFLDAQSLMAWAAAFTMVGPTFIALRQSDARLLLAWHGIGQGGYMLLGIVVGTDMSVAGGLMHVFNYATYQAALFLVVTAVLYRTGTADLDRLGGLIKRMPWSYGVMLAGIIGLAGLPPMNGFVSKWLIYESLLEAQRPLLLLAAFIGTLGTILSVYKLIHNTFLGQLRKEHEHVREVPLSMLAPMLALVAIAFVGGVVPGWVLEMGAWVQRDMGLPVLAHTLGGVEREGGSLNMLWVVPLMFYGFGIGAILFYFLGGRRFQVHQYDNYAGGHFLSADVRYHFSHNFYPGVARRLAPLYRNSVTFAERGLVAFVDLLSGLMHGFYRNGRAFMPLYLLAGTLVLLAAAVAA